MDLSKAFDCIPNDLLSAQPYAFHLAENEVTFIFSCLKRGK